LGYRLDLVVDQTVVVDVKTVEQLIPIHTAQLLTYLRLSNHKVGLLLSFNTLTLKDGIRRLTA
jgi:GxxExxY protein